MIRIIDLGPIDDYEGNELVFIGGFTGQPAHAYKFEVHDEDNWMNIEVVEQSKIILS